MKTEEILQRAREYRRVREALGAYSLDLAGPALERPAQPPRTSPPALEDRSATPTRPDAAPEDSLFPPASGTSRPTPG